MSQWARKPMLPDVAGLRRTCLATLLVLVMQFILGMILNLYVSVPASDQHASYLREIETAPFALTVHVVLGMVLIGAAGVLIIRAIAVGDPLMIALAAVGLGAILGAFVAGEAFVRNSQNSVSLTMAAQTGAALACYIAELGRIGAARHKDAGARARVAAAAWPPGYAAAWPSGYAAAMPPPRRVSQVSGPQPAAAGGPQRRPGQRARGPARPPWPAGPPWPAARPPWPAAPRPPWPPRMPGR